MTDTPAPWYHVTYHIDLGASTSTTAFSSRIDPVQVQADVDTVRERDGLLWIIDSNGLMGVPASRIALVEIRPCKPHEIPEGD